MDDLKGPKYKGKVVMPPLKNGYGLLHGRDARRMHAAAAENNIKPAFDVMKKGSRAPTSLPSRRRLAKHAELFQTGQAIFGVVGHGACQPLAQPASLSTSFIRRKVRRSS